MLRPTQPITKFGRYFIATAKTCARHRILSSCGYDSGYFHCNTSRSLVVTVTYDTLYCRWIPTKMAHGKLFAFTSGLYRYQLLLRMQATDLYAKMVTNRYCLTYDPRRHSSRDVSSYVYRSRMQASKLHKNNEMTKLKYETVQNEVNRQSEMELISSTWKNLNKLMRTRCQTVPSQITQKSIEWHEDEW